jgi:hypothetical protein
MAGGNNEIRLGAFQFHDARGVSGIVFLPPLSTTVDGRIINRFQSCFYPGSKVQTDEPCTGRDDDDFVYYYCRYKDD